MVHTVGMEGVFCLEASLNFVSFDHGFQEILNCHKTLVSVYPVCDCQYGSKTICKILVQNTSKLAVSVAT
jgi:hypothetical protein